MIEAGTKAPEFTAVDQTNTSHTLSDYRGQNVVLFFYPKDMTAGCTAEACDFRDNYEGLNDLNAVVFGISADSIDDHAAFAEKYHLPFPLLVDESKEISNAYGVWQKKQMYGKEYEGIVRTTYIIDPDGSVAVVFPRVKVEGHVKEVMDALAH